MKSEEALREQMERLLLRRTVLRKVAKAATDAADVIDGALMGADGAFSNATTLIYGLLHPTPAPAQEFTDQVMAMQHTRNPIPEPNTAWAREPLSGDA